MNTRRERILVVEDERDIHELLRVNLCREGYEVCSAYDGEEALSKQAEVNPDLILLDLMLPALDGLSVCKTLKADPSTSAIPVIMLTAKGEESDVVTGLELGADDYVTKPFSPRVLLARIRAILRRVHDSSAGDEETETVVRIHNLEISPGRREVLVDGEAVALTATEFGLLSFLARRPGWVFTRYQILQGVRGEDAISTDRAVDVQIVGLRRKLGAAGRCIETVRGVGYRFMEAQED
ncbi:MAG: response regulator [Planctomycetota bacterium]|jgi:two-component system phosphate regulon response regulator PhoB